MKQLIAITFPIPFIGESGLIVRLFENGLQRLHLRKPEAEPDAMRRILDNIPSQFHPAITLHGHFELIDEYPDLGGLHLNRQNPKAPNSFHGRLSCSCHNLKEVQEAHLLSYCFLSPIFNSISKEGYTSLFSLEKLHQAAREGIIGPKVFALGGISPATLPYLKDLPFGGAAVLGSLWGKDPENDSQIIERLTKLLLCIKTL